MPLFTNPGNTGLMPGDCRATIDYRSQWGAITTPFVTTTASYEKKKYMGHNYLGYGIMLLNDRSGTQTFRHNEVLVSLSFQKVFGTNRLLSLGLQGGFAHKSIKSNITFDNNYDDATGGFNPNFNSGETVTSFPPVMYPDVNFGFMYAKRDENFSYQFGSSIHHIFNPDDSFLDSDNDYVLNHKYSFNGEASKRILGNIYMDPKVLYMMTGNSYELVGGGDLALKGNGIGFLAGAYFRKTSSTSDALIPLVGITKGALGINISYDVNVSRLSAVSGTMGGYEIAIVYNCASSKIYKVAVPCRRY